MIRDYKELEVWKKSVALTIELYKLTGGFPVAERFGLTSQIRRASISVPANIAEGWGRGSRGEYIQFLTVARGSLMELETHLIIAGNLNFLDSEKSDRAMSMVNEIEKMLNRLIAVLRNGKAKSVSLVPYPVSRVPRVA